MVVLCVFLYTNRAAYGEKTHQRQRDCTPVCRQVVWMKPIWTLRLQTYMSHPRLQITLINVFNTMLMLTFPRITLQQVYWRVIKIREEKPIILPVCEIFVLVRCTPRKGKCQFGVSQWKPCTITANCKFQYNADVDFSPDNVSFQLFGGGEQAIQFSVS